MPLLHDEDDLLVALKNAGVTGAGGEIAVKVRCGGVVPASSGRGQADAWAHVLQAELTLQTPLRLLTQTVLHAGEDDYHLVADIGRLRDQCAEVLGLSALDVADHKPSGVEGLGSGTARILQIGQHPVAVIVGGLHRLGTSTDLVQEVLALARPVEAVRWIPVIEPWLRTPLRGDSPDAPDLLYRVLLVQSANGISHLGRDAARVQRLLKGEAEGVHGRVDDAEIRDGGGLTSQDRSPPRGPASLAP